MGANIQWLWLMPAVLLAAFGTAQESITADSILERLDRNTSFKTAYVEGEMIITAKDRVSSKSFFAYFESSERTFIEYVSPARDRGVRMLRNAKDLQIYLPSARKVMKIKSGRQQRRLGSDFSFDDIANLTVNLKNQFGAEVLGAEMFDGRLCHLMRLVPRVPGQTYSFRKMWVDQETAVNLRTQFFTRSGKLAKELTSADIRSFGVRFYPTRLIMADQLRKKSQTEIILKKIIFDIPVPPGIFDEKNLIPVAADE